MLHIQLRLFRTTKKTGFITRQFTCFKKVRNEIPDILAAGEQAKVAAITATGIAVHSDRVHVTVFYYVCQWTSQNCDVSVKCFETS